MASEVKSITSEALEAAYRALTPSQSGFTQDLMASNTIIPVLDLTASAGGTSTPQYLQTALAFGSQTAYNVVNTTSTLVNVPGFYRVFGNALRPTDSGAAITLKFSLTDGLSSKDFLDFSSLALGYNQDDVISYDFVVFIASGISLTATSSSTLSKLTGSTRQVATVNGTLVNPSGFTPQ